MWDTRFDERDVKEIRTKTTTYLGVGAIAKIDDIAADLKARGIDSILCVTGGHSYKLTGAWDYVTAACAKHGIRISLYTPGSPAPNPRGWQAPTPPPLRDNRLHRRGGGPRQIRRCQGRTLHWRRQPHRCGQKRGHYPCQSRQDGGRAVYLRVHADKGCPHCCRQPDPRHGQRSQPLRRGQHYEAQPQASHRL